MKAKPSPSSARPFSLTLHSLQLCTHRTSESTNAIETLCEGQSQRGVVHTGQDAGAVRVQLCLRRRGRLKLTSHRCWRTLPAWRGRMLLQRCKPRSRDRFP